ncbi:MAG: HAD-IA family hydrolase [Nitrospirota bacterium]
MESIQKKVVDLIIFDQDGTLVDSISDITNSVNYALDTVGLSVFDVDTIRGFVGEGITKLIEKTLGPHKEFLERARSLFLEYYSSHLTDNTYIYPNVVDLLEYFKRKKKAVISNKLESLTKDLLEGLGIIHYFDIVLGGDSIGRKKPFPDSIIKVLDVFDVKKSRVVMIGDSPTDIKAGKGAGVLTCGVTYGYRGRDEILSAEPDFLIDDILELKEIIE